MTFDKYDDTAHFNFSVNINESKICIQTENKFNVG